MDKKKQIIIPIYKPELSVLEMQSLRRIYQIMHNYEIIIIKPKSIDLEHLLNDFPLLTFAAFPDHFFNGISGYNKLMMSSNFYKFFLDQNIEYILLCQLDVYIFYDKLEYFLSLNYDYIGAPWLNRRLYQIFPFLKYIKTMKRKYRKKDITWEQNTKNQIGNGGFSLRKVQSFYDASLKYSDRIKVYEAHQNISSVYNEDTFWSKEPSEFRYPSVEEALQFSFDKYPQLCFYRNKKKLPMGCHGWYKWKWRSFWEKHIDFDDRK